VNREPALGRHIRLEDVTRPVASVRPESHAREILKALRDNNVPVVPVVREAGDWLRRAYSNFLQLSSHRSGVLLRARGIQVVRPHIVEDDLDSGSYHQRQTARVGWVSRR